MSDFKTLNVWDESKKEFDLLVKKYGLLRINIESKEKFDEIAIKYSKKTTGLFDEMCQYYKDNFLSEKTTSNENPLNLEEALISLRREAISFLSTIEKINLL